MSTTKTRCEAFLQNLTEPVREVFSKLSVQALEDLLGQTLSAARTAWPTVDLDAERFFTYLARRAPQAEDAERSLSCLASSDLYLACACAQGNERAITALEARYFREIDHALARLNANASLVDDVKQRVRHQLFVGDTPGIANYSGSGQLRRWIRVIAVRSLHRLRAQDRKEVVVENDVIDAIPAAAADPELQHLKQHYREAFRAAFAEAMTSISSEDRLLLRAHFIDNLNIDEIAALHRVHRATAARWLAQTRETIATQTRKLLLNKIKGQRTDFDSILRLVQSQLDLSIRGHLRSEKS